MSIFEIEILFKLSQEVGLETYLLNYVEDSKRLWKKMVFCPQSRIYYEKLRNRPTCIAQGTAENFGPLS